jgi:hypothetical protein
MIEKNDIKDKTKVDDKDNPFDDYEDFDEKIVVKAGKSVPVEVKAVIAVDQQNTTAEPNNLPATLALTLYVRGEDSNGTEAGKASATMQTIKFVEAGSLTVSDSVTMSKKTVALQENEITMAKFILKPSKSESVKLTNLVFDLSGVATDIATVNNNVTVEVDGEEVDVDETKTANDVANVVYDGSSIDDIKGEVEVVVKVR